jgi:hypothetical protein
LKKSRELAQRMYAPELYDKDAFQGTWAAEPRLGLKVLLFAVKPSRLEGADGPPAGRSLVIVHTNGKAVGPLVIEGLYPPEIGDRKISARGASLPDGLPIVASGNDLFIGMRIRSDGGLGGLWRWRGGDKQWELEKIPRSIYSIISDPRNPGRLLASTAPAEWESGARKGRVASQFFERPEGRTDWREIQIQVPQMDSSQAVQLCGFAADGTLYLLNNQALFAVGSERLYQRWLASE